MWPEKGTIDALLRLDRDANRMDGLFVHVKHYLYQGDTEVVFIVKLKYNHLNYMDIGLLTSCGE